MNMISEQIYPDYFPEGCPPDDAAVSERELFRFCRENVPMESDFVSYYLQNSEKYAGIILAYGLSVLPSRDECRKAYRKFPFIRKYRSIAVGKTNENRGSWKITPGKISPEHITWWVCENVKPIDFFEFDSKNGDDNG